MYLQHLLHFERSAHLDFNLLSPLGVSVPLALFDCNKMSRSQGECKVGVKAAPLDESVTATPYHFIFKLSVSVIANTIFVMELSAIEIEYLNFPKVSPHPASPADLQKTLFPRPFFPKVKVPPRGMGNACSSSSKGCPVGRPSVYRATFVEGDQNGFDVGQIRGGLTKRRSGFWHELLMSFVLLLL